MKTTHVDELHVELDELFTKIPLYAPLDDGMSAEERVQAAAQGLRVLIRTIRYLPDLEIMGAVLMGVTKETVEWCERKCGISSMLTRETINLEVGREKS